MNEEDAKNTTRSVQSGFHNLGEFFNRKIHTPQLSRRSKELLTVVFVSMISTLGVLAAVGGILWHNRTTLLTEIFPNQKALVAAGTNSVGIPIDVATAVETPHDLSVSDVVAKANKSVVAIEVYQQVPVYASGQGANPFGDMFPNFFFNQPQQQIGTQEQKVGGGSGFFVTSDGMIATNRHVVDFQGATFKVVTTDGKKYNATVLAKDGVLDVAILKVIGRFTPVTLGNSDTLVLGQSVVAIGNALGEFKNSVSTGIISGLARSIVAGDNAGSSETLDKVIQTDAAINPGNSGGPLLSLRGEVVGINVAVAQGSQNIAFSLPINSVKTVIDSVKKNGTIVRPYVGIRYIPITKDLQTKNNLTVDYGILIGRGSTSSDLAVMPGSPADRAGLVENDIILSVDGVKLDSDTNFATLIRGKRVGQTIVLRVIDKGIEKTVQLTLTAAPN